MDRTEATSIVPALPAGNFSKQQQPLLRFRATESLRSRLAGWVRKSAFFLSLASPGLQPGESQRKRPVLFSSAGWLFSRRLMPALRWVASGSVGLVDLLLLLRLGGSLALPLPRLKPRARRFENGRLFLHPERKLREGEAPAEPRFQRTQFFQQMRFVPARCGSTPSSLHASKPELPPRAEARGSPGAEAPNAGRRSQAARRSHQHAHHAGGHARSQCAAQHGSQT